MPFKPGPLEQVLTRSSVEHWQDVIGDHPRAGASLVRPMHKAYRSTLGSSRRAGNRRPALTGAGTAQ
jgi:hypothetical protein